ncbi:MAG: DUF4258 domain-containing protein [Bacteriovoracaceae bacterium]
MSAVDKKEKATGVQQIIEQAWKMGKVRNDSTAHSKQRSEERAIDPLDLRDVILYGDREEEEDEWKEERGHWTYALRNKDVDGRDIRIIFDIEAFPDVVVVTVMHVYP